MDLEKILSLVAVVVYGFVSIVLSVVRTLKTSRISSEVKAILPSSVDVGGSNGLQIPDDSGEDESMRDDSSEDFEPCAFDLDDLDDEFIKFLDELSKRHRNLRK